MDIKNFFSGILTPSRHNVLHTQYGDFNLAKASDRKRINKMVIELQRTTDALTRKDIADWHNAWQMAINVDNPNRSRHSVIASTTPDVLNRGGRDSRSCSNL